MIGRRLLLALGTRFLGILALAVAVAVVVSAGLTSNSPPVLLASTVPVRAPDLSLRLRPVRVLIHSDVDCVWIGADHELVVYDDREQALATLSPERRALRAESGSDNRFRFGANPFSATELRLRHSTDAPLLVSEDDGDRTKAERRIPGTLRIRSRGDGRLDVINEVDVETYVASVVAGEVWPTFNSEAMRAQAIAARTYVVYQMLHREQQAFDVSATQSSQVYRGVRSDDVGIRAADAARYTRGILCTHGEPGAEQVFCAYYSAACGGLSQPAAVFGPDGEVPPLAGGVGCDYCKIAPAEVYRWGPVRLSKDETARRLGAKYSEVAAMDGIRRLDVLERTSAGRPTVLRVLGRDGRTFDLLAERFRHAIGPSEIRSTDFRMKDQGADVVFDQGRGFGHGLGLCQWGAEGQARLGRHAGDILRHYYPGAKLTKGY